MTVRHQLEIRYSASGKTKYYGVLDLHNNYWIKTRSKKAALAYIEYVEQVAPQLHHLPEQQPQPEPEPVVEAEITSLKQALKKKDKEIEAMKHQHDLQIKELRKYIDYLAKLQDSQSTQDNLAGSCSSDEHSISQVPILRSQQDSLKAFSQLDLGYVNNNLQDYAKPRSLL